MGNSNSAAFWMEACLATAMATAAMIELEGEEDDDGDMVVAGEEEDDEALRERRRKRRFGHLTKPRKRQRLFQHDETLHCIYRDYLGAEALFIGANFKSMFRISRSRFQKIMEDVSHSNQHFYKEKAHAIHSNQTASLEAKLLLPLKALAFGLSPNCFSDYFQMSQSFAFTAAKNFDNIINVLYGGVYFRSPTAGDLKNVVELHKRAHGVNGMLGSIDCTHAYWKNCPKAWQGSCVGRSKHATIVLESICDYNLWFWHGAYGFAGSMNDIKILDASPLLSTWDDGSFEQTEQSAGMVPYNINEEQFEKLFVLADGIYPRHSRFVKTISQPCTDSERRFVAWQESKRKDVERAFGVLQQTFKYVSTPILQMKLDDISSRVRTCMILHNMIVSDRIMNGDVDATYNPANSLNNLEEVQAEVVHDFLPGGVGYNHEPPALNFPVGLNNQPNPGEHNPQRLTQRWEDFQGTDEHDRLQRAIVQTFEQ